MAIKFLNHIQIQNNIAKNANIVAALLPLTGNSAATDEIYLCHYSEHSNIQVFKASQICRWLDGVTVKGEKLKSLANIPNISKVNSLYVIRVGITGSDRRTAPEFFSQHSKGGASEYALTFDVLPTEFTRIPITYDPTTDQFS